MSDLNIAIGKFDKDTGTVPVTFTCPDSGRAHSRAVNAALDARGRLDRTATRNRVQEVAAGIADKFAAGLLGN